MSKSLSGKKRNQVSIDLEGILGTFEIPNGSAKVKFFSTFASNRIANSMEFELLKELKPMRERTNASELENLEVLFQRDLNDSRIAQGLIPYLSGNVSKLAFFPAILGVLIPEKFINDKNSKYPKIKKRQDGASEFEDYWSFTPYKFGNDTTSMGVLSINPSKSKVLIIDGQHRANAFRYVTNTFLADTSGTTENDVYRAFYEGVSIPEEFKSDLPITIIWFESSNLISPTEISRKLFVDVNNTARKVNISRNILLDDFDVASLLTRFFLTTVVAKNKFLADKFSLLHSGFDIDSDASTATENKVVITSPQKIKDMMSWFFLGNKASSIPEKYTAGKNVFLQITEFNERIPKIEIIRASEERRMQLKDSNSRKDFEIEFNKQYASIFWEIFNEFILYKKHFKVCEIISGWSSSQTDAVKVAWNKIICGGEGLYYTYKEEESLKGKTVPASLKKYLQAIKEIEKEFEKTRLSVFGDRNDPLNNDEIRKVYNASTSIAFQVGLIMAFRDYEENNKNIKKDVLIKKFIGHLNSFSIKNWVVILDKLKYEVSNRTEISPKSWPIYQKIFLKMIETKDSKFKFFDSTQLEQSIEGRLIQLFLRRKINDLIQIDSIKVNRSGNYTLKNNEKTDLVIVAKNEMTQLFKQSGIKMNFKIKESDIMKYIETILKESSIIGNNEETETEE